MHVCVSVDIQCVRACVCVSTRSDTVDGEKENQRQFRSFYYPEKRPRSLDQDCSSREGGDFEGYQDVMIGRRG